MPSETIFCKHYRAMAEHDTCKAGVAYSDFRGVPYEKRPCFWRSKNPRPEIILCQLMVFPSAEEIQKRDEEMAKRFENMIIARVAIEEHIGHPWKKGKATAIGKIECPVCKTGKLNYSRAGYNGHIHAKCSTPDCVCWIE